MTDAKSKKRKREGQVFYFMVRWSKPASMAVEEFSKHEVVLHAFKLRCEKFVFQLENPKTDGKDNYHYQCYVKVKCKKRPSELACLLGKFVEVEGCKLLGVRVDHAHDFEALKAYSMKTESRVAGPWADKRLYEVAPPPDEKMYMKRDQFKPWMVDVEAMMAVRPPDFRIINWVCDPIGNTWKSAFCEYIELEKGYPVSNWGDRKDTMERLFAEPPRCCYIWDLDRAPPKKSSMKELISTLEAVKGGKIEKAKYKSETRKQSRPHVWVFSNLLPEFKGQVSVERWKLWTITDGQLVELQQHKHALEEKARQTPSILHQEMGIPASISAPIIEEEEKSIIVRHRRTLSDILDKDEMKHSLSSFNSSDGTVSRAEPVPPAKAPHPLIEDSLDSARQTCLEDDWSSFWPDSSRALASSHPPES